MIYYYYYYQHGKIEEKEDGLVLLDNGKAGKSPQIVLDRRNLNLLQEIGGGQFGKVYLADLNRNDEKIRVACKMSKNGE